MVALARRRLGDAAEVLRADLDAPLPLPDAEYDLVVSPLVMDYIRDLGATFRELARVLKPGGRLVFSMGHPLADLRFSTSGDYFATERAGCTWRGFGEPVHVPFFRRPLGDIFDALAAAGLTLERLLEPRPTPAFEAADPEGYRELMTQPGFLCIRARR